MKKSFIIVNIVLAVTMVLHIAGIIVIVAFSNTVTSFPWWAQLTNAFLYIPVFIIANLLLMFMAMGDKKGKVTQKNGFIRLLASVNISIFAAAILSGLLCALLNLTNSLVFWNYLLLIIAKYIPIAIICNCILIIYAIIQKANKKGICKAENQTEDNSLTGNT